MIEDAESQSLEHDRLRERALHREHRRPREVRLAFAVAEDRPAEAVPLEERDRLCAHDPVVAEVAQLVVVEAEVAQLLQQAAGARDDAEASRTREASAEQLEDARTRGRAVAQGRVDHRELVLVGQQRGRAGLRV